MNTAERRSLGAVLVIVLVAAGMAWAGSQGGLQAGAMPLFAWCVVLAFAINWAAFVPAYLFQTERFFDLVGSFTYVSLIAVAVIGGTPGPRAILLGALVGLWAVRLGSFLFRRIRQDGSDRRFDALKPSWPRFLAAWTLQGLWVLLTLSCALAAMTSARPSPLDAPAAIGALVWVAGFAIEVAADRQKHRFREESANRGRFIQSGLWAWSRHPNYFGEITLWIGMALIASPALTGWQHATLVSPLFVYVLLTRISGIPLLEDGARKRWGDDPAYQAYCTRTPVLFLRPPRST